MDNDGEVQYSKRLIEEKTAREKPPRRQQVRIYLSSLTTPSAMFGNWTLTTTHAGHPVGKADAAGTAWWTCPIEAAADMGLKPSKEERQDGPMGDAITL